MRNEYQSNRLFRMCAASSCICSVIATVLNIAVEAEIHEGSSYKIKSEDVIASASAKNLQAFENIQISFNMERKQLTVDLLNIFNNPKSSNLNRCFASYYLGEIRSPEAAQALANNIGLEADMSQVIIQGLPVILGYPAMDALIKIGNPSIPHVIRNLEDTDDAKVRELSLQALNRIEVDKDITQLRLQKALEVQREQTKKTRLQAALKSLTESKTTK